MKKIYIYAITIIIFFIIGVIITNFVIMPSVVHLGEEVTVPNICNLPLDDALEELRKHNLDGVIAERRYDHIIDEGHVIVQNPLPGEQVKIGRIINLSISLGAETVKIPYLIGLDLEKGKMIIRNLGLVIESVDSAFSDSIPLGKIMKTVPEVESEVKKGDALRIVVSRGSILRMPDLLGLNLNEARGVLKNMGLTLGEIRVVEASGTKGNIIIQHPEPEQVVSIGDTVNVMVIK